MHHVAIMKKAWGLLEKIISGDKTIESRWYKTRRVPWDKIKTGDTVWFKNAGEKVTVKAKVVKVIQFEDLTPEKVKEILAEYGERDGISQDDQKNYYRCFNPPSRKSLIVRSWDVENISASAGFQHRRSAVKESPTVRLWECFKNKKYCLLVFINAVEKVTPFDINKTGFGAMSAWITVDNIHCVKM